MQACLRDFFLTFLTAAKGPLADAIERITNLDELLFLVLDEAERKFLLEVVGSEIGHVERRVGQAATGLATLGSQRLSLELRHVAARSVAQSE